MNLKNIRLYDFRNFQELETNFKKGINVFYGDNAQGKTNLLEAIYFLTTLKPARTFREQEVIRHDKSLAFVKGLFNTSAGPVDRQVTVYRNRKKEVQEDGILKNRWSELSTDICAVYFSPEDLELVKGEPSGRRRFVDTLIYQLRPAFYKYLQGYRRVLSQRNSLLKTIKTNRRIIQTLDSWDEQLAEFGSQLIKERLKVLYKISALSIEYFKDFVGNDVDLRINYLNTIKSKDSKSLKQDFLEALKACREKDILRRYTSVGPHRDDIEFLIDGMNVRHYGSQGQQRILVLCIKFAHRNLLFREKGEYPILLLDDVMSELDSHRRRLILEREENQVFITTTDLKFIPDEILSKSTLYSVKNGVLR